MAHRIHHEDGLEISRVYARTAASDESTGLYVPTPIRVPVLPAEIREDPNPWRRFLKRTAWYQRIMHGAARRRVARYDARARQRRRDNNLKIRLQRFLDWCCGKDDGPGAKR